MATSNRDRIGTMFEAVAPAVDDFISSAIGAGTAAGANWADLVRTRDEQKGITGKSYEPLDPQVQLRMLTENIPHQVKPGWRPFDGSLTQVQRSYASELREVRNRWAHNGTFTDDDAYRALDTAERLLKGIGQGAAAAEVARIRLNLRRVASDRDDRRTLKATVTNPESAGLRPWREVLPPRHDVATGNFHASEFAADLHTVSTGTEADTDYADAVEFFRRTYLTEGLRDLIDRAVRRLAGDDNASPVINLQTDFGGGKTHSMLALWHLAAGRPSGEFPQETQELLVGSGYTGTRVNRVALVGHHMAPSGRVREGTAVNTIWGELAWQLGGREAFGIVAAADAARTPPGQALHDLLAAYAPAVVLIDEWVAYARSLVGRDDLAGGTFDDQFTFAQQLTEVASSTPGVLLAISIPASETGDDPYSVPGRAEEVGGTNGLEALKRLQNVVRRVADQWRPASSGEAYDIVRQRLFTEEDDAAALASIRATATAYAEMYRRYDSDFPRESRDLAYEDRIRRTYPIHPEMFDTLHQEWSSLERFQRTRGVLRLMSHVIHGLWVGEDAAPLIMPGSIPLATSRVNAEFAQYLQDSWRGVIDADVDGENSEPARIDRDKPLFGRRSLTRRLARTVFFGAVPTIGSAHKGIETQRVFLGTAMPGDVPGNFHSALTQLGDRATYFYSGSGKYWYDLRANITRTAKDQAERLHKEDVWAEITRRLQAQARTRGDFAGVHVCPEGHADIPDTDEARLVILHPKVDHKRKATDSLALGFAHEATRLRGAANRTYRNTLVYLAADRDRLAELDTATRDYLGWSHVLDDEADLDLTQNQRNQATQRRRQADQTVRSRLLQTFVWALVPTQPRPAAPFAVRETKVEGQSDALAERVSRRLGNDGDLATRQAAAAIRLSINRVPAVWEAGHVALGELWTLYATYPYMPRLRDRHVLDAGVVDQHNRHWQLDAFALAAAYDEAARRYVGLWTADDRGAPPPATDSLLLVKPDAATRQRDAETPEPPPGPPRPPSPPVGTPDPGPAPAPTVKRFFGTKALDTDRYALDFTNIADEVVAHLRDQDVDLVVRIEIEATSTSGFTESKIRTVAENAATLRFDQAGFEEA